MGNEELLGWLKKVVEFIGLQWKINKKGSLLIEATNFQTFLKTNK